MWSSNKPFNSLKGKQILAVIKLIPEVVKFIDSTFMETPFLLNLCSGLTLWKSISKFIHTTSIIMKGDKDEEIQAKTKIYEEEISNFNKNLVLFYDHGAKCFLTKKDIGDCETFYMHTLRYYLSPIVDDTWKRYQLGTGIFTMQGFERRNKESKGIFNTHTNKKVNQLKQCIHQLYDIFHYN